MKITKRLGVNADYWSTKTESEFIESFKDSASEQLLKEKFAEIKKDEVIEKIEKVKVKINKD